jgi:hypothetical protein
MTDILQKIEEIIKREFLITAQGGSYFLTEQNEPSFPPTLIKQRGKMLIYSFDTEDSNSAVFPIFNSSVSSLTSIADYIIFYPKNDALFVFICNLKSTNRKGANSQAEAGFLLSEYIVKTTQRMMSFKDFKVEYRSLLFWQGNVSRFQTNSKSVPYDILGNSKLKNLRLEAGQDCILDVLCV